jgi:hypothetical protein
MLGVCNAWIVWWMDMPDTNGIVIRTVPLPSTSTPTPPTREGTEGGSKVTRSLRKAVKLIEHAELVTPQKTSQGKIEIEIELVYNMYRKRRFYTKSRMRRLLSLGPPNYAIHGTYKSGLDR